MPKVAGINAHCRETLASHMPILLEYLREFPPDSVAEFGCGLYSTGALLASAATVLTVEMAHPQWLRRVEREYGRRPFWTPLYRPQREQAFTLLDQRVRDLAFVDDGGNRAPIANHAMLHNCTDTVIVHDTQQSWRKVFVVPLGWTQVDFRAFPVVYKHNRKINPWTTLFTRDLTVLAYFTRPGLEAQLYERYRFPYSAHLYKRKER